MKKTLILLALLSCSAFANSEPTGALNANVTQANIKTTICVANWTRTVRPTVAYTNKVKKQQMAMLKLTGKPADYEEDHYVPLALGGHPTSVLNLWPELWADAKVKDLAETEIHRQVCAGKLTLDAGQQLFIKGNWPAFMANRKVKA